MADTPFSFALLGDAAPLHHLSAPSFPSAKSFTSHVGTGAPMAAAFSAMLPSSVKIYHTSRTLSMN